MDCCDVNGLNQIFRGPLVRSELRTFRRHGLSARQQALLGDTPVAGNSVLDIGCGIGSLGLTCLQRGASGAAFVDVSRACLEAARSLAQEHGVTDRASFHLGDAAVLPGLPEADLVTLDRVVCCYPDAPRLLARVARLSRRRLVFSYPSAAPWMRAGRWFLNRFMELFGRRYRFFLHEPAALLAAASEAGLELRERQRLGPWIIARLVRSDAGADEDPATQG